VKNEPRIRAQRDLAARPHTTISLSVRAAGNGSVGCTGAKRRRHYRARLRFWREGDKPVFEVIWLRGASFVEKETSRLPRLEQVVARSRGKFADVKRRHPGNEPDAFRIRDDAGSELGYYPFTASKG
jgi:hypothetical protein